MRIVDGWARSAGPPEKCPSRLCHSSAPDKLYRMAVWDSEHYLQALNFASRAHRGQTMPGGDEPYLRHLATVAGEVMSAIALRANVQRPDLAVVCAVLHDCVEDTEVELGELQARFGPAVAAGVAALTKNPALGDKHAQMLDSLTRIQQQPEEIWMVKLADRITNLQAPPSYWPDSKVAYYRQEAELIHHTLHRACPVLGPRLLAKIERYPRPGAGCA